MSIKLLYILLFLSLGFQVKAQEIKLTPSGLTFTLIHQTTGSSPDVGSKITVAYKGYLSDGTVFEEVEEDEGFTFKLEDPDIIPGWNEGFALMKEGERAVFIIPPSLAYGSKGVPHPEKEGEWLIPPGATLRYEVVLMKVK
jgi:FKBP-type peptidyl-prolyl cis-trans isomerase